MKGWAGYIKWGMVILVVHVALVCGAQKYDYIWETGYYSSAAEDGGLDTSCNCYFDNTRFDFNDTPVTLSRDSLGINFYRTNSTISDSNGNLLFYCNGVRVWDRSNELMLNGDSLGWGPEFSSSASDSLLFNLGQVYQQALMILPNPLFSNLYDLFYSYIDTFPGGQVKPSEIMWAQIDMSGNGGLGTVVKKNVPVLNVLNDVTISAVRHGNGRDWWLITNQQTTNCHEIILYTGTDSLTVTTQCSGNIFPIGDGHGCRFSPDGNYYITSNDTNQISVFNFDRCTGHLNLLEEFNLPHVTDSLNLYPTGIEFSPDSRFFYVFCGYMFFQYDITASSIESSSQIISVYHYLGHNPADYFWGQLGPDGKIYVAGGNGSYYMSVIDSPNGAGASCNFLDQAVELPSIILGLPYYPNYQLGSLTQSQCDTLALLSVAQIAAKEQILKVFPNPATDVATVDYGFTDWNKGAVSLQIANALGQVVYMQALPMYSGYQQLDISRFAAGVYTVYVMRSGGVVAAQKLVVEH